MVGVVGRPRPSPHPRAAGTVAVAAGDSEMAPRAEAGVRGPCGPHAREGRAPRTAVCRGPGRCARDAEGGACPAFPFCVNFLVSDAAHRRGFLPAGAERMAAAADVPAGDSPSLRAGPGRGRAQRRLPGCGCAVWHIDGPSAVSSPAAPALRPALAGTLCSRPLALVTHVLPARGHRPGRLPRPGKWKVSRRDPRCPAAPPLRCPRCWTTRGLCRRPAPGAGGNGVPAPRPLARGSQGSELDVSRGSRTACI